MMNGKERKKKRCQYSPLQRQPKCPPQHFETKVAEQNVRGEWEIAFLLVRRQSRQRGRKGEKEGERREREREEWRESLPKKIQKPRMPNIEIDG